MPLVAGAALALQASAQAAVDAHAALQVNLDLPNITALIQAAISFNADALALLKIDPSAFLNVQADLSVNAEAQAALALALQLLTALAGNVSLYVYGGPAGVISGEVGTAAAGVGGFGCGLLLAASTPEVLLSISAIFGASASAKAAADAVARIT